MRNWAENVIFHGLLILIQNEINALPHDLHIYMNQIALVLKIEQTSWFILNDTFILLYIIQEKLAKYSINNERKIHPREGWCDISTSVTGY